jgi:methylenetetrahydrofolate--tRNA-(uracil-5-)-methyltransferase
LRYAGQITGCEGYVESAAVGLVAGRLAAAERFGRALSPPPATTAIGALLNHITGGHIQSIDAGPRSFQPMNVNFGLFPPIAEAGIDETGARPRGQERGVARKRALSARAEKDLTGWIGPAP